MKKLYHPILGVREFQDIQADRIMNMEKNGGWEVYKDQDKDPGKNIETDGSSAGTDKEDNKGKSRKRKKSDPQG